MRSILAIMTMVLGMSACTTTPEFHYIDAEARPLINTVDSVLIVKQNAIDADIKTSKISSVVQGHIIPVLIDVGLNTYRSHKMGKLITPIRQTLGDYDFTADLKEEFNQGLAESTLGGVGDLQVLSFEPQGFRTAYIRKSEADAVMFIDSKYAFTPSFDALNVVSSIMIFPVNPALSPYKERPDTDNIIELTDNIYRNQFMASVPVGIEGNTIENSAVWAAMSEEELTTRLQIAASKLADHISADLSMDEPSEDLTDAPETPVLETVSDPVLASESLKSSTGT